MAAKNSMLCYNRGCGQRFNPEENGNGRNYKNVLNLLPKSRNMYSFFKFCLFIGDVDDCLHHPGAPFFHDAYKGWSCCKKKCTDFTEFLNIKVIHSLIAAVQVPINPVFIALNF